MQMESGYVDEGLFIGLIVINGMVVFNNFKSRYTRIAFFFMLLSFSFTAVKGQDFVTSKDFEWRLIGRALFDGGVFFSDSTELGNGVKIYDVRLGTTVRFLQDWTGKIEIGFSDSKVALKDVFIAYNWGVHTVKVGHYFEPFALEAYIGTSDYRFLTPSETDKAFGDRRKVGLSYTFTGKNLIASGGFFSDGDVDNVKSLDEGYTVAAKLVGLPVVQEGKLVRLGISSRFSEHDQLENQKTTFIAGAPTALLTKDKNEFIKAGVTDMINQWRFGANVILLYNRWYLQSEYILAHVNRFGGSNYNADGAYGQVGFLLRGKRYKYNQASDWVTNPDPGNVELLFRYNVTNLNDKDAGVMGGKEQDITLGVNYVFNKYILAKLNYSHVMFDQYAQSGKENFDLIQARVQFSF